MSMVYCRSCGHQVHETVRFCPDCGASQTSASSIQDSVTHAIKKSDFPPIAEFLFSSKGRVTRFQLWMSLIANFVIQLFLFQMAKSSDNIGILIIYTAAIIYPAIVILIKRCRDTGLSPKYLWLLLVPLIGFIPLFALLFSESDGSDNSISSDAENIKKQTNSTTSQSTAPDVSYKSRDSVADENSIIDEVFDSKQPYFASEAGQAALHNSNTATSYSMSEQSVGESTGTETIQHPEPVKVNEDSPKKNNDLKKGGLTVLILFLLIILVLWLEHTSPPSKQATIDVQEQYDPASNTTKLVEIKRGNSDQGGASTTQQSIPEAPKTSNIIDPNSYQVIENLGGWSVFNDSTRKDKFPYRGIIFSKIIMQNEVKYLVQIQNESNADLADMTTSILDGYSITNSNCTLKAMSSPDSLRTDIFATVKFSGKTNDILKAWRVDVENNKFVELSPNDVKCTSNTDVGNDGDVD